jgi:hypothetical protein
MADETLTIVGHAQAAEEACQSLFLRPDAPPVRRLPAPLLAVKDQWPGRTDQPAEVTLELPYDFDISRELPAGHVMALTLTVVRVTVLHQGKRVGYALRTNPEGLGSILAWERAWAVYNRKIRQAH